MTNKATVQDYLATSSAAKTTARLDLGTGRSVTIWQNRNNEVSYCDTSGHTFCCYLAGGQDTRRVDGKGERGWPGALCIFPEGHSSSWAVANPVRFVHLHLADEVLRPMFARTHDCDARWFDLPELTYGARPELAAPMRVLAEAAQGQNVLLADSAIAELVGMLAKRGRPLKGGLPPGVLRRVDEWIDAHLDHRITLDELAQLAGYSQYHFHRMFRASRGLAVHRHVTARRIERARLLLGTKVPICQIAIACGFASQSHLSRVFLAHTGLPPAAWRKTLRGE